MFTTVAVLASGNDFTLDRMKTDKAFVVLKIPFLGKLQIMRPLHDFANDLSDEASQAKTGHATHAAEETGQNDHREGYYE
jgi:hypothetical protein